MSNEADAMVLDFIETSREALDEVESGIIKLEKDSGNTDILNEIFRSVHSIKGTAGFLGFEKVVNLAHAGEELLNKLRKSEVELNADIIDVILHANDGLRDLVNSIADGHGEVSEIDSLVSDINAFL